MDTRAIKSGFYTLLAALSESALVLVALFLLSCTAQNSDDFDRLHNVIFWHQHSWHYRAVSFSWLAISRACCGTIETHVPGAKLKARMVGMFVGLAVLPLIMVFYFSMQFINRGIDTWFNIEVEEGMENALELSQAALSHADATTSERRRSR